MNPIKKLFYQDAYAVGIRRIDPHAKPSFDGAFQMLMPTDKEWYADSFCFEDGDDVYLFCEIMGRNGGKGTLGVSKFDPETGFSAVREILREPFHLSYPNVFRHGEQYYMIPETNEAGQIRLYEAVSFPEQWRLKTVLYQGAHLVDSSLLEVGDGKFVVFSHDITDNRRELRLFQLNMANETLTPLPDNTALVNDRPGGNVIWYDGNAYRILQDCSRIYGEKLKVYRLCETAGAVMDWTEEYVCDITAGRIKTDQKVPFCRIHTLTRSEHYEAIDMLYNRFYITRPFAGVKRILGRLIGRGRTI